MLAPACAREGRPLSRVEDGFLRSRGLGARLVPPLSLVQDDLGIYYDPSTRKPPGTSDRRGRAARPARLRRAERLIDTLTRGTDHQVQPRRRERRCRTCPGIVRSSSCPDRWRMTPPSCVGAGDVDTNLELLRTARRLHPNGVPDLQAAPRRGGRPPPGAVPIGDLVELADHVANGADPLALIARGRPRGDDDLGPGIRGADPRRSRHDARRAVLRGMGPDDRSGRGPGPAQGASLARRTRSCHAHRLPPLPRSGDRPALPGRGRGGAVGRRCAGSARRTPPDPRNAAGVARTILVQAFRKR
jgi:hypothetical protein